VLKANVWTHLAGTYDGSMLRFYINGVHVANRAQTGPIATSSGPLRIGGNSIWGEYFKGRIDEVRVYNRALSASAIQTDMNTAVTLPAGTVQPLSGSRLATRSITHRDGAHALSSPRAVQANRGPTSSPQHVHHGPAKSAESAADHVMPWHPDLLEFGEVLVDHHWQRVQLQKAFVDPVVIAGIATAHRFQWVSARVRHVEPTGFEVRLQQWPDQEGADPPETIAYLVMERGTYSLGNQALVEAGRFEIADPTASGSVAFSRRFNVTPVVVTTVTSAQGSDALSSELRAVTPNGVECQLQAPHPAQPDQTPETISYVAWEPSSGTMGGLTFQVNMTPELTPGEWHTVAFTEAFATQPVSLVAMQMLNHGHPGSLHWLSHGLDSAGVMIDDLALDEQTIQDRSIVGYIILN
jgi:hypothetical protein